MSSGRELLEIEADKLHSSTVTTLATRERTSAANIRCPVDFEKPVMSVTFRCPGCQTRFRIDERMRGKKVQCPNSKCQNTVLIPAADATRQTAASNSGRFTQPSDDSSSDLQDNPLPATDPDNTGLSFSKPLVLAGIAILFVLVTATGSLFLLRDRNAADPFSDLVSKTVPQDQPPTQAEKEAAGAREQAEKDSRDQEERERQETLAAEEAMKKAESDSKLADAKMAAEQEAERIRQEATDAQAKAAREAAISEEGPFSFIKADPQWHDSHGQWLFELPPPTEDVSSEPLPLLTNGEDVELCFCESAVPLFAACPYQLTLQRSPAATNTWLAVAVYQGTQVELGEYTLEAVESAAPDAAMPDHHLRFRWRREAAREVSIAELLLWWPLQISVGDRTAVLLQRSAYVPERPLEWESIVDSQKILFPRSTGMRAIEQAQSSLLSFCLEIRQTEVAPQTLCLSLANAEMEDQDQDAAEIVPECVAHFPLTLPLKLQDTLPDVAQSPLGFGTLVLQVSHSPEAGLVILPKLELTLRLPGKEHLGTFPSPEVLQEFTLISREPQRIGRRFSANGILQVGRQRTEQTREDPAFWHRQPLRALGKKSSFELLFIERAEHSIKFLKGIIRTAEGDVNAARIAVAAQVRQVEALRSRGRFLGAAEESLSRRQQTLNQAETILSAARQLGPAIGNYCIDMERLIKEFTSQHESLMQDLDAINQQVDQLLKASLTQQFQLRAEMTALLKIPQADNGPSIRVYFIEASSKVAE
jgi:hypothetical protein